MGIEILLRFYFDSFELFKWQKKSRRQKSTHVIQWFCFSRRELVKLIKVSDFGLIWRPFREYLQIKNFFQETGSVTFLPFYSRNFMQKIRKILRAVYEKTTLPTNQPTSYYQQHRFYRAWLTPVQKSKIV